MLSKIEGPLDSFLMGDQPVTCPQCGTRSKMLDEWMENLVFFQDHICLNQSCRFTFNACSD